MIALDTNILVYAHREDSPFHSSAADLLRRLSEGHEPWTIPWPCVYEFLRVVTHPRLFNPPTPLDMALRELRSLFSSPSFVPIGEGPMHAGHFARIVEDGRAIGNLAHDAHIAALVVEHGVSELWTTDRDFARFPGVRIRNPFLVDRVSESRPAAGRSRRSVAKRRHAARS